MIRRSVLVCAVKTRRRFSSETASFYVSVCSYVIFFFTIIVFYSYYFHVNLYYILPVWLIVSLHETLLIVHLIWVVDISLYLYH